MGLRIEQLRHVTVSDQNGHTLGPVGRVYVDDHTGEPAFVTVRFPATGSTETFVSLAGARTRADELRVLYPETYIKDAPSVDAGALPDQRLQGEVLRYYSAS